MKRVLAFCLLLTFGLASCEKNEVDRNCGEVYYISEYVDTVSGANYHLRTMNPYSLDDDLIYVIYVSELPYGKTIDNIRKTEVCLCDLNVVRIFTWDNSINHWQDPPEEIIIEDYCSFKMYVLGNV